MKVLAIIPARGGSKRVEKKNIKHLLGKPLIYYSIQNAKDSKYITDFVVSTEDKEIAKISEDLGAPVIMRHEHLAVDTAKTEPVLVHVLEEFKKKGKTFDFVVLLQPTTPFRTTENIDKAIALFKESNADSVVSVMPVQGRFNPFKLMKIQDGALKHYLDQSNKELVTRDQDAMKKLPVYTRNGQIYITKTSLVEKEDLYGEKCVPFVINDKFQINIDEPEDFALAEFLVNKGVVKL